MVDKSAPVKDGESLEQIRHNLSMSDIDQEHAGIMLKPGLKNDSGLSAQKKKERAANDALFYASLDIAQQLTQATADLHDMEQSMEKLYGEDFDLNFAATLLEDDYKRIASMKDIEERRAEVARMIREGLADGSIKPEEVDQFPKIDPWLGQHEKVADLEQRHEYQLQLKNELSNNQNAAAEQNMGLDNQLSAFVPSP